MKKKDQEEYLPVVCVQDCIYTGERYIARGEVWSTPDLVVASKEQKLVPFKLPLASIDISLLPWSDLKCLEDFMWHAKRVKDSDLKYPIILDVFGRIADGWHRIAKAILKEDKFIMAVRLQSMPRSFSQEAAKE